MGNRSASLEMSLIVQMVCPKLYNLFLNDLGGFFCLDKLRKRNGALLVYKLL